MAALLVRHVRVVTIPRVCVTDVGDFDRDEWFTFDVRDDALLAAWEVARAAGDVDKGRACRLRVVTRAGHWLPRLARPLRLGISSLIVRLSVCLATHAGERFHRAFKVAEVVVAVD